MSTRTIKLLLVAGARPNFMKVAPLIRTASGYPLELNDGGVRFQCRLVHTGQHYDAKMSEVFFRELGIPQPDYDLGVGSGPHGVQTGRIMVAFEPILEAESPDWLVVVGDVNSTVACALVAAKAGVRTAHVEAGLRSFDRAMPEEINRLVTDAISDLLLTPSEDANTNLRHEGVPESRIAMVGNIMIDALMHCLDRARQCPILADLRLEKRQFAYVTLHRPSNVDDPTALRAIMGELAQLAERLPVVFPVHPRTKNRLREFGIAVDGVPGLRVLEPVGYLESLCLAESARLVLTDSGGLQEETTFFRTPCLTLRPNTERPVTVAMGSNRLTSLATLRADVAGVLDEAGSRGRIPPLWDGKTSQRILQALSSR